MKLELIDIIHSPTFAKGQKYILNLRSPNKHISVALLEKEAKDMIKSLELEPHEGKNAPFEFTSYKPKE